MKKWFIDGLWQNSAEKQKNRKTELKKTVIALGVKYAKKFKMDRMDPMDPMDFLRYQKNKIVHLVYLVHLVHKMLIRLPADQTGIRLQRAWVLQTENISLAGNFEREINMSFCHKPTMRHKTGLWFQRSWVQQNCKSINYRKFQAQRRYDVLSQTVDETL